MSPKFAFILSGYKILDIKSSLIFTLPMAEYTPKPHVVLVANGEPPPPKQFYTLIARPCSLIAVDGGFHTCIKYQHIPELVLGDLDSAPQKLLKNYPTMHVKYTPDQTKTDLEKALDYLLEFHVEQILVLGALGKRLDHSYKNLELLAHRPGKITFHSHYEQLFSLPNKSSFTCKTGTTLSLIPFGGPVTKVSTRGLKWELQGKNLDQTSISNVATEEQIHIQYEKGHLLCSIDNEDRAGRN